MVLSICGCEVPSRVTVQDLNNNQILRDHSLAVIDMPVRQVGDKDRCLYVGQREMAVIAPGDNVNMFGSEDATTCHIVILRDKHTGVTGLAHIETHQPENFLTLERAISKRIRLTKI